MRPIRFTSFASLAIFGATLLATADARAHCEIPCGIYDDQLRADLIAEHITTIEKSMKQVIELSKAKTPDYNQLARWVANKDAHARELQEIVFQYFMTQRIKPVGAKDKGHTRYVAELTLLHGMLVHAMKAKQTTDLTHVNELRALLGSFRASYFAAKGH